MKTVEEVQKELDESVNVLLGQHRGRVDVVNITTHPEVANIRFAHVKMSGGCQGCAGAKATLNSIVSNCIKNFDRSIIAVVDASDHTDKTNAFFTE